MSQVPSPSLLEIPYERQSLRHVFDEDLNGYHQTDKFNQIHKVVIGSIAKLAKSSYYSNLGSSVSGLRSPTFQASSNVVSTLGPSN